MYGGGLCYVGRRYDLAVCAHHFGGSTECIDIHLNCVSIYMITQFCTRNCTRKQLKKVLYLQYFAIYTKTQNLMNVYYS